MPIAPFPHRYPVALAGGTLSAPPRDPLRVGSPPQFGGTDTVWSPEELLVGAVVTCLQTTFDAYARRDALVVDSWAATATGVLAKGPQGPVFTEIEVNVQLTTAPGTRDKALEVLALAERSCIISRALSCPVRVIAAAEERPAASS